MTTSVTPSLNSGYGYEDLTLKNTETLTNLAVTITIQNTGAATYDGAYNTVGSQITQSNSGLVYTFTQASGATLSKGTWDFVAELESNGSHAASGDTWKITYSSGGNNYASSGTF